CLPLYAPPAETLDFPRHQPPMTGTHLRVAEIMALRRAHRWEMIVSRCGMEIERMLPTDARREVHVFAEAVTLEVREQLAAEGVRAKYDTSEIQPVCGNQEFHLPTVTGKAIDGGAKETRAVGLVVEACLEPVVTPQGRGGRMVLRSIHPGGDTAGFRFRFENSAQFLEHIRCKDDIVVHERDERSRDLAKPLVALDRRAWAFGAQINCGQAGAGCHRF